MRWGPFLMCCWPGLSRLWLRGNWTSLTVAVGFAILLNLALVSTFLWPSSLGDSFPMVAWPMILLVWVASAVESGKRLPDLMAVGRQVAQDLPKTGDTLFNQAQSEYLRGHWEESESILRRRLQTEPRDIESRLLLATLLRHLRRFDEARFELATLRKFDESNPWEFEIDRELRLIELIQTAEEDVDDESAIELADESV